MKKRMCYMFVFEGYSDWEPSLAIAGLQKFTDFQVKTFSMDGKPVRSMGNVQVMPDLAMEAVLTNDIDLLLLPGGEIWDEGGNQEILPLMEKVLERGNMVAAICGATGFLARNKYLDEIRHTSNHLDFYLREVAPGYQGERNYIKAHAVKDGQFITANGTAIVAFADAIFEYYSLYDYKDLSSWFQYFKHPEMVIE